MSSLPDIHQNTFLFLIFSALIFCGNLWGQNPPSLDSKKYTIGKIAVTGNTTYNENTIVTYTGLRKGQEIYLPGDKISKVIKKLWDLQLFSDIDLYITSVEGNVANLELHIEQVPELKEARIEGVKKSKSKELIKENNLNPGAKVTENLVTTTRNYISNKYRKNGFLNTKVVINTTPVEDTVPNNKVNMLVRVDKGERVKVESIEIVGNEKLSDGRIRKAMKNTKQKQFGRFWKRSKYIEKEYKEDKENIIAKYKEKGYRDARILSDSLVVKDDNNVAVKLEVEEGNRYYFGDINFIGNSVFTDRELARKMVIKKGDVYNGVLLKKRIQDNTKPDADDLTNLYQNNGYLFSNINAVEVKVENDTIDFEIRIQEGKLAHFNKITVVGNDKTNDHVVYREIRTKPGQQYSKELVVRTLRELGQLGFFDPEQLEPKINPDVNNATVDVEYKVVEKGSSQIELQGGFGGSGFVGTLGLAFNNFSMRNIFNKEAYRPLPMGDGQTLRLRAQASTFFRTYSLSFIEPWLGGKKPFQLSTSFSHSQQFQLTNPNRLGRQVRNRDIDRSRGFSVTSASVGIARRLKWPDNFFTVSHSVSFSHYDLNDFNLGRLFSFSNGASNNLAYTFGISRNSLFTNPIFPMGGSNFNLTAKFTPPYSLFNGVDYANLGDDPEFQNPNGTPNQAAIDQERFNWLEFYKIKFKADWYTRLIDKLVLKTSVEYGFLGAYDNDRGIPPFERFFLGGDGLGAQSLDGRDVVALRGYPNFSLIPESRLGTQNTLDRNDGATIYNKYSLELRYPITLKPAASIYALSFLEGGAAYDNFTTFNPFQLNRSAGVGLRIFMPAFGLLGIDFGYGFDPIPTRGNGPSGWQTHFIIGQQF